VSVWIIGVATVSTHETDWVSFWKGCAARTVSPSSAVGRRALAAISPIVDSSERGDSQMLTGLRIGLGMPIGLPLAAGLARSLPIAGILACLANFGVMYPYLERHSYGFNPNARSRIDSVLLCRIAANERIYVEGCQVYNERTVEKVGAVEV
jgi:hypothetical protein